MRFIVAGRNEINEGIVVRTPYVVISISDPGKQRPRIRRSTGFRDAIFLQFHDAEPTEGFTPLDKLVLMTSDHAATIWEFVCRYQNAVDTIVVHCEQGMSRSPAVAAAICKTLGQDDRHFFDEYAPNRYIYDLMLKTAQQHFLLPQDQPINMPR